MDSLFFHPKVVHLPMALAILMPLITGGALFAWWRGWFDRRTWVAVVLLQAVLVGSGVAATKTGEREEDRVEQVVAAALGKQRHSERCLAPSLSLASASVPGKLAASSSISTALRRPTRPNSVER